MAKRKNTLTRFFEDIVDDTKDFVDDMLDRTKDLEENFKDSVTDVVDDDEDGKGKVDSASVQSLQASLATLTERVNQLADLQASAAKKS